MVDRLFRAKHDYLPGTTIFREIDVDTLARELTLEERGERDGKAEVPSSKSARPTAVENEIIGLFRSYWDEAAQGARAAHESYATRAASLSSATEIDTLVGEPATVANKLDQIARSEQDALRSAFDRYHEASAALERFKSAERLERPAVVPKTWGVRIALLLAAFILELAINVSTFASGDEFGLAGALLKVIAVPLLNIGGVFGLVFVLGRHVVRREMSAKVVGVLGLTVAFAWAFIVNLAVAHWRDSLGLALSADAGRMAWERVFNATFELNDINSWVLFFVGCAAALLAAIDAFIWHDPHPGYTSHTMAKHDAEQLYARHREFALAQLDAVAEDAIGNLKDALRRAETNVSRRPELAKRADALAEDLKIYEVTLSTAAENLITRYREANQRARSTRPPARFEAAVALKLPKITLPNVSANARPGEVDGLLSNAIHEITVAHARAADTLATLSEHHDDKVNA
ncbi:hypothetical protein [Brevundimonas sp.]|uniref:hypothetical protein n=1 Tax=Brevundimonas sp. TaxID=1871086 RepID=UPI002FC6A0D4